MLNLTSASAVIDALGGTKATAEMLMWHAPEKGTKDQHVSNWRSTRRLPAWTFLILTQELGAIESSAPPSLWGIKEPRKP